MRTIAVFLVAIICSVQLSAQCNLTVTVGNNPFFPGQITLTSQSTAAPGSVYIIQTGDESVYTATGSPNSITHTYSLPGNYYYCVSLYDSITPCYESVCDSITIGNVLPYCDASFSYTNSAASYSFASNGTSTVSVTHFWNFGDGNTSTQEFPTHTYSTNATYEVCHTVTDVNAQCSDTYCDSVYYGTFPSPTPCQASFYWYQDSSQVQTVSIINNSTGNGTLSYFWDFGDGNTSNLAYPTHQYSNVGIYQICLTITDNNPLMACTSTYCDSVWVTFKATGFTINVYPETPLSVNLESNLEYSIYPNPAEDKLYISFGDGLKHDVALFDLSGKQVLKSAISAQSTVDISVLNSGLYFLSVDGGSFERLMIR